MTSIDHHLGASSGRYFGEGFKRVQHELTNLRVGAGEIAADATLTYPGDWSRKSTGSLRPHLSSIDGLVIAGELADAYLAHTFGLDLEQRRRAWLRAFEMRVAAPTEELSRFAVRAQHRSCVPASSARCDFISSFACFIGTIRVTCAIEHDIARGGAGEGRYATADALLGDSARRHYGDGYKRRTQRIEDVATRGDSIRATVAVEDPLGDVDDGLGGAYAPSVSMVDCLLSMAQLAQVLAYDLDGVRRATSNTFWMRRLSFRAATPVHPLGAPRDAALGVPRSKLLTVGGGPWRALDLSGNLGEFETHGSVAHALPATSTALSAAA
jgi:hypothetical protein